MDIKLTQILKDAQYTAGWLTESLNEGGLGIFVLDLETGLIALDDVEKIILGLEHLENPFSTDAIYANIHPDDIDHVIKALELSIATSIPFRADYRYNRPSGDSVWIRGLASLIKAETDGRRYIAGVNLDITEEKNKSSQEQFVAEEMAHRTKNLIALISGISRMTARNVDTVEDYQKALNSRLLAIDAANGFILNDGDIDYISTKALLSRTLKMYSQDPRLTIRADDFKLNQRAAQTMSLVINELATNAVKYGALNHDGSTLDVKAIVSKDIFKLTWEEINPVPIGPAPSRKGFGSQVTLGITKSTFAGRPKLEWRDHGIYYECSWDVKDFAAA